MQVPHFFLVASKTKFRVKIFLSGHFFFDDIVNYTHDRQTDDCRCRLVRVDKKTEGGNSFVRTRRQVSLHRLCQRSKTRHVPECHWISSHQKSKRRDMSHGICKSTYGRIRRNDCQMHSTRQVECRRPPHRYLALATDPRHIKKCSWSRTPNKID